MSKISPAEEKKRTLRKDILTKRKQLSSDTVLSYSKIICNKIIHTKAYQSSSKICLYMPIQNEVDVTLLFKDIIAEGKDIYLPKLISNTNYSETNAGNYKTMNFYKYIVGSKMITGAYNILEPDSSELLHPDDKTLVIMPGAVFSKNMKRIGYGGGYYDRYLSNNSQVFTIAVAYDFQILDDIPNSKYDIAPQLIISEQNNYTN